MKLTDDHKALIVMVDSYIDRATTELHKGFENKSYHSKDCEYDTFVTLTRLRELREIILADQV